MKPTDYKTFKKKLLQDPEVRKEYNKLGKLKCYSCGADANLCVIIRGKLFCEQCIRKGKVKRSNSQRLSPEATKSTPRRFKQGTNSVIPNLSKIIP